METADRSAAGAMKLFALIEGAERGHWIPIVHNTAVCPISDPAKKSPNAMVQNLFKPRHRKP